MYPYPALECLVVSAIAFLIGRLAAKGKRDEHAEPL